MKIITDTSTLYHPRDGKDLGITILPLSVSVNGKTYKEFVDIDSSEFIAQVRAGGVPTSSQPAVGEIIEIFEDEQDEILVISMADGLSGTYQSAVGARESVTNNDRIYIMNSKTLCGPHRYLVQKAMKLREEGLSIEQMKVELQKSIDSARSFLIPQDFNFLRRGGRLTPIAATVGGLLKIIPVMQQTDDGRRIEKFAIKRTMSGAASEVIKHFKALGVNEDYKIFVSHADVLKQAQEIVDQIKESFNNVVVEMLDLSPAFITQGGPDCIAIQMIKM